jgi:hypothetical protein
MKSSAKAPLKERVAISMQWGVPNCLERPPYEAYDSEKLPHERWAWEFFRRRDDVREAYEMYASETDRSNQTIPGFDGERLDEPGFWAMPPLKPLFGMAGIPNPRIADQPLLEGLFDRSFGQITEGTGQDYLSYEEWTPQFMKFGTVMVSVDVSQPLKKQLDVIRISLEARYGRKISRIHQAKWPLYLRVIDALAADLSYGEIDQYILTDYDYQPASQAARDVIRRATSLRDNFPL